MRPVTRALVGVGCVLVFCGCSAEAAPEPDPTLDTKGAFFAVRADSGALELFRTLAVVGQGKDNDAFFVVPYVAEPRSFQEARELAQDPDLPHRDVTAFGRRYITSREWRVVWFRSVSVEEEQDFR